MSEWKYFASNLSIDFFKKVLYKFFLYKFSHSIQKIFVQKVLVFVSPVKNRLTKPRLIIRIIIISLNKVVTWYLFFFSTKNVKTNEFWCLTGTWAVRQLLPSVHKLSEREDADRPGHRRPGQHKTSRARERSGRWSAKYRRQRESHRRSEHAGRCEYLTFVNIFLSARRDNPPPPPTPPSKSRRSRQ